MIDQGEKLGSFLESYDTWLNKREISEAVYTMNECGLWPDGNDVSVDQVIKCWQLIQYLNNLPDGKFPEYLKM